VSELKAGDVFLSKEAQRMPTADQGVTLSQNRYQWVPRVLCFVTFGPEVLLLQGAPTKRLWAGKYNGLGGHVERGESVHAAALREIREEAGLEVRRLRLRGVITVDAGPTAGIGLFVFTAEAQVRAVTASAEGTLHWVQPEQLPGLDTVEDLPALLPYVLARPPEAPCFGARYFYSADQKLVMEFFDDPDWPAAGSI
jgi:8-oxo-dGTP diphosphatase